MMKFKPSRELKIGIVVVVAIGMLYFGLNYLKGINIFQPTSYFYAQYERVDGIVPTTPVMINGYQVGHVSEIIFDYTKEAPITLLITVDNKLVVPQGTVAEVYDTGLMGDKAIQLKLGKSNKLMQRGDTLRSSIQNGLMAAVSDALVEPIKAMMPQIDTTLQTLKNSFDATRIQAIIADAQTTMAQVKNITASLEKSIPTTMDSVQHIANNFAAVSNQLQAVQWDSTLVNIEKVVANLENVSSQLKSNENSLGALLNDKELYQNLDSTVQSANALLIDLKENPKRYVHFSVFGSKDKKEEKK